MKYEFTQDQRITIFCPEEEPECRLVFDILGNSLRMAVPFFVERDRDFCHEHRNGGWFAWPFHLKRFFRTNGDPFTLILDVALPVDYEPGQIPVARWCESLGDPSDEADLLYNLNLIYPGRFDEIKKTVLLEYLRVLGAKNEKKQIASQ